MRKRKLYKQGETSVHTWGDENFPWLPWYAWHPVKITSGIGAGLWAWRKVVLRKVIVHSIRIPDDTRLYKDVPTKL